MPTYKNISQEAITGILSIENRHVNVLPFHTVETYRHYDNIPTLEKQSDEPYFNPIISSEIIILENSSDSQTVQILENCKKLEVINSSDYLVYLYLQSIENTPPILITSGMTLNFEDNFRRFTNVILKSSGEITTNKVFVVQLQVNDYIY